MDLFGNLILGFSVAVTPTNLLFCFFGALVGTLIGVLPGLGAVATISMLLPATFYLSPITSLIMLAGIYYGAQYGGSTTSILVNIPGESTSVVTCLDGHQMAKNGRAGSALAIAALASFFAGTVVTLLIAVASPPLTKLALQFGAAEYFSLMVVGLIGAVVLAEGAVIKAIPMIFVGLLLGLVGTDRNSSMERFTFDIPELSDGLGFVGLAVGLYGIADIIRNLEGGPTQRHAIAVIGTLMPNRPEFRLAWPAALRGTTIGSILGLLPGGGAILSSFTAYMVEKKLAADPARFGKGAVEGVAGPEAANNAGAQASFIPMLTLGIPTTPVMALMIGAMMIQGIQPGPQAMSQRPELFWGLIASFWIGNLMLLIINLPLIGIWVQLLKVPYRLLFPSVLVLCSIGAYSVSNSTFDIGITVMFAALGYIFVKLGCEPTPLILGYILGPLMEENLRRAMLLSGGDPLVFLQRPISLSLLVAGAMLLALIVIPSFRKTRATAFQEG